MMKRNNINFDKNFSEVVQLLEDFINPILNDKEITINKNWDPKSWRWKESFS